MVGQSYRRTAAACLNVIHFAAGIHPDRRPAAPGTASPEHDQMNKRFSAAILVKGFSGLVAQILLLRELLIVFSGNELTLGFVLASWFFWVAVGSAIGGRWGGNHDESLRNRFAFFQTIIPFILILQIILIRQSRHVFRLPQMATVGLGQIFWVSFLLLAPLCLILGLMFSLGYQWLSIEQELKGHLITYFQLIRVLHGDKFYGIAQYCAKLHGRGFPNL